ncbi:MAG: Na+/H+ antiporter NhaC [Peptococcaceae bacterium]|jgi:NhaC family Na+:H+ antiporter|nr:Na+/H+ antiporter NhaC [Peptococcaceae bacterium]
MSERKQISLILALIPLVTLVGCLFVSLNILDAGPHIPIVFSTAVAAIIAICSGYKWGEIEKYILETMASSLQAITILLIVGALIGTWILSGVVPTMIYYGLMIISPKVFLLISCVLCSIVSLATGSSWSTAGTVGIALMGIGRTMGIPLPLVAGSIISGAYFGDKMSPLSDTTNMAPAVAGSELFEHIKHMVYTVTPSLLITLVIYTILGFRYGGNNIDPTDINEMMTLLADKFAITPILLIPPILVIVMVVIQIPSIPGLFAGAFLGAVFAMIIQGTGLADVINASFSGFNSQTGNEMVDSLLSSGGMSSMAWTITLIFVAMAFGGVVQKTGMLDVIIDKALAAAKSTGSLILATLLTCIAVNILTASQYLSIVITGNMFRERYIERGLHPKNLSRCLEDAGTVTSPLIPWNNCGAFMASTLGVSAFAYAPFAFFCYITPIVSAIYGYTGFSIEKLPGKSSQTQAS